MLVGDEGDCVALHGHLDRDDLVGEPALGDGAGGAGLAVEREGILIGAADLVVAGDVLGGHAHMAGAERAVEGAEHHVLKGRVAHPRAPARLGQDIGRAAHRFGAAGEAELGVAEAERLERRDHRLGARPAEPVDVHRRHRIGHPGLDRGDAGKVHILRLGIDDIAEGDGADPVRRDPGAAHRLGGSDGAEPGRRDRGKRAAERADRGPRGAENHDVVHCLTSPLPPPS